MARTNIMNYALEYMHSLNIEAIQHKQRQFYTFAFAVVTAK